MSTRTKWAASDKTLLLSKVRELGLEKGVSTVAQIVGRSEKSVRSMYYAVAAARKIKQSRVQLTIPKAQVEAPAKGEEIEIPIKSIRVDPSGKKLIIKV